MQEYRFEYDHDIPAGRVLFQVHNAGTVNHRLTLLPLPDDLPPVDEMLRDSEPQAVTPLAGVHEVPPGDSGSFAVELEANQRYALVCFVADDDDGKAHGEKGMNSEFRADRPGAGTDGR